jgi:hypothetical protein
MSVYPDQYVIINIWTNSKNKALPGVNGLGHMSITTPNRHISLFPDRRQSHGDSFFKGDQGILSPFLSWPTSYNPDYEQDCLIEGAAYDGHRIGAIGDLNEGEMAYLFNNETSCWKKVDSVPKASKPYEHYYGVKPVEANFRMVLYSLDIGKIEREFDRLKESTRGWKLVGSNALSRNLQEETSESCASLVYRCLKAGGLYSLLDNSFLSSQTSSAVDHEDLLRHIVAAKEKELTEHSKNSEDPDDIANWTIDGVEEISVEKVKEAYREKGLNASAQDDFLPGIKPSANFCSLQ